MSFPLLFSHASLGVREMIFVISTTVCGAGILYLIYLHTPFFSKLISKPYMVHQPN